MITHLLTYLNSVWYWLPGRSSDTLKYSLCADNSLRRDQWPWIGTLPNVDLQLLSLCVDGLCLRKRQHTRVSK